MPNQIINTIGLIQNIAGVVVLFLFGPPKPSFEEGISLGLEDATPLAGGKAVTEMMVA